jgi:propionyl-CoA carboxylase alpha chain
MAPDEEAHRILVGVAVAIDYLSNERRREISDQMNGPEFRFSRERVVLIDGEPTPVVVEGGVGLQVSVSMIEGDVIGERVEIDSNWWPGQPLWVGTVDDYEVAVQVRPILNGYQLSWRGTTAKAYVYTRREAELAALMPEKQPPDLTKFLLCPMPGLVKQINVEEGAEVQAGDALAVVEAMKMENVLRAERDGRVKAVKAAPGDSLAVDEVIIEFE